MPMLSCDLECVPTARRCGCRIRKSRRACSRESISCLHCGHHSRSRPAPHLAGALAGLLASLAGLATAATTNASIASLRRSALQGRIWNSCPCLGVRSPRICTAIFQSPWSNRLASHSIHTASHTAATAATALSTESRSALRSSSFLRGVFDHLLCGRKKYPHGPRNVVVDFPSANGCVFGNILWQN